MRTRTSILGAMMLAVLAAGYFAMATPIKAADGTDSPAINQLFSSIKMEAVHLKNDSEGMQTFIGTDASWGSYSPTLGAIKDHIDNAGKLAAALKDSETKGSTWQQATIKRIAPLLKELAENTSGTIKQLNASPSKVHTPPFQDYVNANYDTATGLENLILNFVDYGKAKNRFDSLASKVEAGN